MLINSKAKEDFDIWYGEHYNDYHYLFTTDEKYKSVICNIIIEWFDSVYIYISILPYYMKYERYNKGFEPTIMWEGNEETQYNDNDVFETRQDATVEAIKRANNIYNTSFKK